MYSRFGRPALKNGHTNRRAPQQAGTIATYIRTYNKAEMRGRLPVCPLPARSLPGRRLSPGQGLGRCGPVVRSAVRQVPRAVRRGVARTLASNARARARARVRVRVCCARHHLDLFLRRNRASRHRKNRGRQQDIRKTHRKIRYLARHGGLGKTG